MHRLLLLVLLACPSLAAAQTDDGWSRDTTMTMLYAEPPTSRLLIGGFGGATLGLFGWGVLASLGEDAAQDVCDEDSYHYNEQACWGTVGIGLALAMAPVLAAGTGAALAGGAIHEQEALLYGIGGATVGALPGALIGYHVGEREAGGLLLGVTIGAGVGAALGVRTWWEAHHDDRMWAATPIVGSQTGLHLHIRF